jgi:hypothetical protein
MGLPWVPVSAVTRLGGELGPIVGAQDEEVRRSTDHTGPLQLASDPDGRVLAGEFVNDVEHPDVPAIMGPGLHKIVGPESFPRQPQDQLLQVRSDTARRTRAFPLQPLHLITL